MIIILKLKILHDLKKMICYILVKLILLKKRKKTNTNDDDEYRKETSKLQDGNESVDNSETSETLSDESVLNVQRT